MRHLRNVPLVALSCISEDGGVGPANEVYRQQRRDDDDDDHVWGFTEYCPQVMAMVLVARSHRVMDDTAPIGNKHTNLVEVTSTFV